MEIPGSTNIRVMTNNNSIVTRSPSEDTTVTNMVLNVTNDSSFRERSKRKDIPNHEISLLSTVNELTRVHTLCCYVKLLLQLVPERVTERDSSEWSTTPWVMDDVCHNPFQVPISLAKVQRPEPSRTLTVVGVGLED